MFDLSLPKISVVLMLALFVLGPERLPSMVRQAGRWLGELHRLRESVESEVKGVLDELPGGNGAGTGGGNILAGMESPFAGLHESVSSIGSSLRSVLGTGSVTSGGLRADVAGNASPAPGNSQVAPGNSQVAVNPAAESGRNGAVAGGEGIRPEPMPADPSLN